MTSIWVCEGCGRTFLEYVNGCVWADIDPNHPAVRSVVLRMEILREGAI